jgi:hypothetical protein
MRVASTGAPRSLSREIADSMLSLTPASLDQRPLQEPYLMLR